MTGRHYPVGIETFSEIRDKNYVYIDKTELIHKLVTSGKYYFLSRPRRFGKSLLLSTIRAFFEGRRDLFEGLAITRHEHIWDRHPVFHLNLVNASLSSEESLKAIISQQIEYWEKEFGVATNATELPQRFYAVIRSAAEQTGKKCVVLIDEYDKPLVSTLDNSKLHDTFKAILKPIYGTLKAADQYIRFGMITGVSRFSRLSIFSDVNNLNDISLDNAYSAICGITVQELLRDCREGIEKLAANIKSSFEDTVGLLKRNYDGYHFTTKCPDLYNPFSLFCAFEKEEIDNYWFATGTPTFLMERLRSSDTYLPDLFHAEADTTQLADIDSYSFSTIALLFQTGYLTIKGYDSEYRSYLLGLPNREVSHGFFKDLLPVYMDDRNAVSLNAVRGFCRSVNSGDPEEFLTRLQAFLADIPYDLSKNKPEVYFENNIYIIFKLMGFTVETEYRTSAGRIDLLVKTKNYIYIIELKLNGSAESALAQIEEKGYSLPFAADPRTLYKIGISFSPKTRNIDRWLISR